ncbi:MAG: hypothetical protein IKH04_00415, partial [Kiritimatiellae bacterium]|nr:hypothetical protein [Kiritimatiellia bacterium]
AVLRLDKHPEEAFDYTAKGKTVAVVSDGTAILGLGDRGPTAAIPVMEGKCVLFKSFAGVEAWPVVLDNAREGGAKTGRTDPQRVIEMTQAIAPMYGGINLEDIASPACFDIEDKLQELLDIPVFHDDQWGTAVITLAAVRNYALAVGKDFNSLQVAMSGAGAAGMRIREMLIEAGVKQVISCDARGVIYKGRPDLSGRKLLAAEDTPCRTLEEAMKGADVFIGVSVAGAVRKDWVKTMAPYPAIFAMANPDPEIRPEEVAEAMGDKPYVMATGRSDYPNQINNVLCFPFLFRGALDVRARKITMGMKLAAAEALANAARIPADDATKALYAGETLEFGPKYLLPKPFDRRLRALVAPAVAAAAIKEGVARITDFDIDAYRAALEKETAQ